jgi:hypothetical protein
MFNLKPFSLPTNLVIDAFLRNRGVNNAFNSFFPQTASDSFFNTWLRQQATNNVDFMRTAQGALSGANGVNVAGENAKRRKKLFGFGGFNFDPNDPETLLGLLVGMLLQGR